MTKGLVLARSFHKAGWTVIGADFSPLACGRVSNSLAKFYTVSKPQATSAPYLEDLLKIITSDHVDLWVSCSSVASAVEDGEAKEVVEARTKCKAVQFNVETTKVLHEKHTFLERAASHGLTIPEKHTVTCPEDVREALQKARGPSPTANLHGSGSRRQDYHACAALGCTAHSIGRSVEPQVLLGRDVGRLTVRLVGLGHSGPSYMVIHSLRSTVICIVHISL